MESTHQPVLHRVALLHAEPFATTLAPTHTLEPLVSLLHDALPGGPPVQECTSWNASAGALGRLKLGLSKCVRHAANSGSGACPAPGSKSAAGEGTVIGDQSSR